MDSSTIITPPDQSLLNWLHRLIRHIMHPVTTEVPPPLAIHARIVATTGSMGREIEDKPFCAEDYDAFNKRIHDQLDELKSTINRPEFGQCETRIGAELEIYLTRGNGEVSPTNLQLLEMLNDHQFQPELNQFNIELNLTPVAAAGTPFTQICHEIRSKFETLWQIAEPLDTRPLAIGILPTLKEEHLTHHYMTDLPRYRLLQRELLKQRGEPFHIEIDGENSINFTTNEISVEGANTSFQVHLVTPKEQFANIFNAAQLTMPMALAISANSGILFGRRLWDETRVVLFKQAIDSRPPDATGWWQPARVNFGNGWVRKGAWELFSETANIYEPIFPYLFEPDPQAKVPELAELNLHMGTTWPWNRAVYSTQGNGHLRIEFRVLPAGPTALDMMANAAFSIGMAMGLEARIEQYISRIPFSFAEQNFYAAARKGLDAMILWPQKYQNKPVEVPIKNVIQDMLQTAEDGLAILNVERDERDLYLGIIRRRLSKHLNGAKWAKETHRHLCKTMSRNQACITTLNRYFENQVASHPLSDWETCWK